MATKAVPSVSSRTGTGKNPRRLNDFATLRDTANIVNAAIANYHELHHRPWYVYLWRHLTARWSITLRRSYRTRWWKFGMSRGGHTGDGVTGTSWTLFLPFSLLTFTRETGR